MVFISPIDIIFTSSLVIFNVSAARSCDSNNCFTPHHQSNGIRRRPGRFSFLPHQKRSTLTTNQSEKRYISLLLDCDYRRSSSKCSYCGALASTLDETFDQSIVYNDVDQIKCREVHIDIDLIGDVIILEATAEAQDDLVDAAVSLDTDEDSSSALSLMNSDPYGAVLWPAAFSVATYLLTSIRKNDNIHAKNDKYRKPFKSVSDVLKGLSILELGTGTGLVSLAAALGGASKVIATDYEEIPLRLLDYAANGPLNSEYAVDTEEEKNDRIDRLSNIKTSLFDICDLGSPLPGADIVVAADIMYEPLTGRAMASRTVEALENGSRVIVGCSPGRPGRVAFQEELQKLIPGVNCEFKRVLGKTCSGPRNELICGQESQSISKEPKPLTVDLLDLDPQVINREKKEM